MGSVFVFNRGSTGILTDMRGSFKHITPTSMSYLPMVPGSHGVLQKPRATMGDIRICADLNMLCQVPSGK